MSAWVKTTSGVLQAIAAGATDSATTLTDMITLAVNGSGALYNMYNYTGRVLGVGVDPVSDGSWHQVVYTQSRSGHRIYVDGKLQTLTYPPAHGDATNNVWFTSTDHAVPPTRFLIGATDYNGGIQRLFMGQIDEVSVTSTILSLQTVKNSFCSAQVSAGTLPTSCTE